MKGKDEKVQNNKEWSSSGVEDVVSNSKKQEGSWVVEGTAELCVRIHTISQMLTFPSSKFSQHFFKNIY